MSTAYGYNSLIMYCIRIQAYLTIWSLSKFVIYCSFTDHIHTGIVQKILSTFGITLNRVLFFVCKFIQLGNINNTCYQNQQKM